MGELISHTSIVAIDNMQTYEADNPFLASLFDLSAVIDVDPFGNQDLKMLPGIMLESRIDAYVSPPLVVAVECEGHGSKIPLEASMSYISSEEIQNYYLFEVQLSNDAYLKHEKERRKPSIIEVDQNLCKKPSQSEIDLKRTPPDFINLTADEKFDDYSRLSSSVCAISESKQSATASDQAEPFAGSNFDPTHKRDPNLPKNESEGQQKNLKSGPLSPVIIPYEANPCHVFHMMHGNCHKIDCNHLHDEISFTPPALASYRAYLARHPCPWAGKCKYVEHGNCFYNHICPLGASCSRPACGYFHSGEAARVKIPQRDIGLSPPVTRGPSRLPERAPSVQVLTIDPKDDLRKAWEDDAQPAHRPKDFIPLVKAILQLAQRRGSPKVSRSQVAVFLNASHSWPIGFGRYTDFKHYTHSASRFGYVLLGSDDVTRNGNEWSQSTGSLERACGVEPYHA